MPVTGTRSVVRLSGLLRGLKHAEGPELWDGRCSALIRFCCEVLVPGAEPVLSRAARLRLRQCWHRKGIW
jgi:hypothetical protein